ncbi:hypothetical protein H1R20_g4138, partial [Candolleomyces eurysporus]
MNGPTLNNSFAVVYGPEFIAESVNVLLFGVSVTMAMHYSRAGPTSPNRREPWQHKAVVLTLILYQRIFSTLQTVFSIHHSYGLFVLKFDQPDLLEQLIARERFFHSQLFAGVDLLAIADSSVSKATFLAAHCVALLSQSFFAGRLYLLGPVAYDSSKEKGRIFRSIAALMCIVAFAHFGTHLLSNQTIAFTEIHPIQTRVMRRLKAAIFIVFVRAVATWACALSSIIMNNLRPTTHLFMIPILANTHFHVIFVLAMLLSRTGLEGLYLRNPSGSSFDSSKADDIQMTFAPPQPQSSSESAAASDLTESESIETSSTNIPTITTYCGSTSEGYIGDHHDQEQQADLDSDSAMAVTVVGLAGIEPEESQATGRNSKEALEAQGNSARVDLEVNGF